MKGPERQAWLSTAGSKDEMDGSPSRPWTLPMSNAGYTYMYDGRGSKYRPPNNPNTKSAPYGFPSRPRRLQGGRQHHGIPNGGPGIASSDHIHPQPEPVWPPNAYPDKLMNLLKSSGEYDRLRKQIFGTFQNSVSCIRRCRPYPSTSHSHSLTHTLSNRKCAKCFSPVWTA